MEAKSVLEMAHGAILERVDYVVPQIINNILDENTSPTKKRSLTIVLDFVPDNRRENIEILCTVKPPKLEATGAIHTSLYVSNNESGGMKIIETPKQVPGQIDLTGGEQQQPAILRVIGG